MRSFKSHYEIPPAPYRPGQKLRIEGKTYRVVASTHTHTQLEGIKYAVSNWVIIQLKKGLSDKELSLSSEGESSSFRRITDEQLLSDGYDLSKVSNSTRAATRRGKSPEGRYP
jgi:hypothetical protein